MHDHRTGDRPSANAAASPVLDPGPDPVHPPVRRLAVATPTAATPASSLFALHRSLDHLALDYGDWAVASGLVEHDDDARAHLEHVAEAVEIAATTTGLARVTHWRIFDVQAVITDQRRASAWRARAVLCALSDFLRYLEETGQWPSSPADLRRCARELTHAVHALDVRHDAPVEVTRTPA